MTDLTTNQTSETMLTSILEGALSRNHHILFRQVDGLTHEDSLLQPQPRGNSLNWVVGHVVSSRELLLKDLGLDPVVSDTIVARYDRGSSPVSGDGDDVVPFADLLAAFQTQQDRLLAALADVDADALRAPSSVLDDTSVIEHLHFRTWHETYHLGQPELQRQLSGVNDCVIP